MAARTRLRACTLCDVEWAHVSSAETRELGSNGARKIVRSVLQAIDHLHRVVVVEPGRRALRRVEARIHIQTDGVHVIAEQAFHMGDEGSTKILGYRTYVVEVEQLRIRVVAHRC